MNLSQCDTPSIAATTGQPRSRVLQNAVIFHFSESPSFPSIIFLNRTIPHWLPLAAARTLRWEMQANHSICASNYVKQMGPSPRCKVRVRLVQQRMAAVDQHIARIFESAVCREHVSENQRNRCGELHLTFGGCLLEIRGTAKFINCTTYGREPARSRICVCVCFKISVCTFPLESSVNL